MHQETEIRDFRLLIETERYDFIDIETDPRIFCDCFSKKTIKNLSKNGDRTNVITSFEYRFHLKSSLN